VAIPELGNKQDRVKSSVLGESVGDKLEGLTVGFAYVRVVAEDGTGVHLKLMGDFHFDAGAAWHKGSLFDEGSDNTKGIMEGTVCFVEDELVRASKKDGDGLALVGALGNLNNFGSATGADLLNEAGGSELLGLELVDVSDGRGTDSLGDKFNIITVNILNDHDLLLGEEMESEIADSLSQNTLLEEEDVGA